MGRTLIGILGGILGLALCNFGSAQILDSPAEQLARRIQDNNREYEVSSRIHLQKGTQKGYLVVKVSLAKGYSIYSMTQPGEFGATKIEVRKNPDFKLLAKFDADTPPKVEGKPPESVTEKHFGEVQFFAPIELAKTAVPSKVAAELRISGQVCSEGACLPIRKAPLKAKFAGYFEPKEASKKAIPVSNIKLR